LVDSLNYGQRRSINYILLNKRHGLEEVSSVTAEHFSAWN